MPRVAVPLHPTCSTLRVASRVGSNGRRVRDLGALIEVEQKASVLAPLHRVLGYLLTRLFIVALWAGCFLTGAFGCVYLRFY